MKCPKCGAENPSHVVFCGRCGAELYASVTQTVSSSQVIAPSEIVQAGPPSIGGPLTGGILTVVCGMLALGSGVFILLLGRFISSYDGSIGGTVLLWGVLIGFLGFIAIAGGVFVFRRDHFLLALLGAVMGMLGAFFALGLLALLLGIVAVIVVANNRNEFTS